MKKVILILAAVLLGCSVVCFQSTPSLAADVVNNVEQNAPDVQYAPPPPPPPAPPVPPTPPSPPVWHPAPFYPPEPVYGNGYGYGYPYIYRWSTFVSPRVYVLQQPAVQYVTPVQVVQPVTQVVTQTLTEPVVQTAPNYDPPPVVNSFSVDPVNIKAGQSATLSWSVSDVLQREFNVTITPTVGAVSSSGSVTVNPAVTTTYTLTATNVDGTVTQTATVTVDPVVAAAAYTSGAGPSIGDSGLSGTPWLAYILLLGLLAAAAVAITIIMARRRQPAYAAAKTGFAAGTQTGTKMGTGCTVTASGARLTNSSGTAFPLSGKVQLLGRNDFQSMLSADRAELISRQHVRIERRDNEYFIEDNDSTNGTKVNGLNITGKGKQAIRNNDLIELGGVLSLTFKA